MAFLKHATVIAALAGAGVVGMAGVASAAADDAWHGGSEHHKAGDNNVGQGGLIPVNTLNNPVSYWVPRHSPRVFVERVDMVCGVGYDRAAAAGGT